jgi:zinc protease
VQEEEYQRGLAHFVEHMCFNGTKHFPKDSLVKFLESTGVKFGPDLNAGTGFDEITYMLTLPLDVPNMLENGIQVLED